AMRRVALLLNRNAQRVKPPIIRLARSLVAPGDVFVTGTPEEGRAAVEEIARAGYDALCVGGGDGSFMQVVRDLIALCASDRLPALMRLRLGTGNAIADVAGASAPTAAGLRADVAFAASDAPPAPLPLLEVDGQVAHFTGVGIDAMYAADHQRIIKQGLRRG